LLERDPWKKRVVKNLGYRTLQGPERGLNKTVAEKRGTKSFNNPLLEKGEPKGDLKQLRKVWEKN